MSIDASFPTKSEADALAALIPKDQICRIPVDDYLLRLVQFCERNDVRDFLFNKDPFQLTFLSNPNLAKNSVTGQFCNTQVEDNKTRYFSHHVRSLFLMAPVFATDHLNFGFGVHEFVFNPANLWDTLNPGLYGRALSRFVRDDAAGVMVIVLDQPDLNAVQIDYKQLVNTTGQIHAVARFRRQQLHAIYESGIFNLKSLTTAMISIQASLQVRNCRGCGAKPKYVTALQPCNCNIPRVFPKHPFDMSSFCRNMEQRLGTFQGAAHENIYEGGKKVHGVSFGNQMTISGGVDPILIERLQKWAICSSAPPEDPRQSLMQTNATNSARVLLPNPLSANENQSDMQVDLPLLDIDETWYGIPGEDQFQLTPEVIEDIAMNQTPNQGQLPRGVSSDRTTGDGTNVSEGIHTVAPEKSTTEGQTSSSRSRDASTVPNKNDTDDGDLVKKLRAELRKERNRASAQRSNLRKKAENDARKLEIKTNKEKAMLLRAKEMMLRQENMRLRQQLGAKQDE